MNFDAVDSSKSKTWKDIWGCDQGIGTIDKKMSAADYIGQLESGCITACKKLSKNINAG